MKKILYIAAAVAALSLSASCSKEIAGTAASEGEGSISLGVSLTQTKAAMTSDELLSDASVKIYMGDFSGLVREYKYSEAPEKIYLAANEYRVDVEAGEAAKASPVAASWEQKSYKGSTAFTVVAGQSQSVQVEAKVVNAISKVSFDATVAENFSEGYTFTVGLSDDSASQLVYDASKSGSEGYFIISGLDEPEFSWTFSGTLSKDGSAFTKSGVISGLESGKVYPVNVKYTIKDGTLGFDLYVDYSTDIVDDTIIFEPVSTGLSSSSIYEIWSHFATVHADVDEAEYSDPTAIKFAYKAAGDSDWKTADAVRSSEGVYDACIEGLSGSTEYEYKLVIAGEDQGESKTFTTTADSNVPNASFEYVSLVSGKSYYKWYDPSCSVEDCQTMFWGSGNGEGSEGVDGSASMGYVITAPSDDAKDGSRSVCAQSTWAVVKFAAGNIFTGNFAGLVGTKGGKVNFGRPWTTRPTGVRLWVKYSAGVINRYNEVPDGADVTENVTYDRGNVKIALGTWDYKTYGGSKSSPVLVNTTDKTTFVDYGTDASTIADGELILFGDGYQQINGKGVKGTKETATVTEWRQITIPFAYHNETTFPTHIIISCAASMYGDYFTGCDTAKLWVDGVELIYDKL